MSTFLRKYCKACFSNATGIYVDETTKQPHFNVGTCPNSAVHKDTDKVLINDNNHN